MGYCCFCIPFRVYALSLGCLQFTVSLFHVSIFSTNLLYSYDKFRIVHCTGSIVNCMLTIAGGFLIFGVLLRRNDYIANYLILMAFNTAFLIIGVIVCIFFFLGWAIFFFIELILTCLFSISIYVFFDKINNGNATEISI